VPIYVVPRALMCQTVGFAFHRGIMGCGQRGPAPDLARWLADRGDGPATLVVCPDVHDPTNLGSIIRATAALGGSGVVLGRGCADPFSRRVLRVSMGAALVLPVFESGDLAADLTRLRQAGFARVAAVLDPAAQPLSSWKPPQRVALLLGNEGHGLAPAWQQQAECRVTIPMQAGIDSLNVAAAAAVLLYHVLARGAPLA
jgi:tRNA G18 (ribose-2'-O)-methylase SpoU